MFTGRYRGSDLGQVKRHAFGVAAGQDEPRRFSLGRADGAVDVGRFCPLVLWCRGTRAAPGSATRDAVLLADPRLVLPPDLYGRAAWERRADRCQRGGEGLLKAGMASASRA